MKDTSKDTSFMQRAACRDTEIVMFPETTEGTQLAIGLCEICPVVRECLTYALKNGEEHGVWGATSGRTRTRRTGSTDSLFEQARRGSPSEVATNYIIKLGLLTTPQIPQPED